MNKSYLLILSVLTFILVSCSDNTSKEANNFSQKQIDQDGEYFFVDYGQEKAILIDSKTADFKLCKVNKKHLKNKSHSVFKLEGKSLIAKSRNLKKFVVFSVTSYVKGQFYGHTEFAILMQNAVTNVYIGKKVDRVKIHNFRPMKKLANVK